VPDVRGLSEAGALQALRTAGLTLGGLERVSAAALQQQFGKQYAPGIVVQQAPRPSGEREPSWLPRGSRVWLRVSAGTAPAPAPAPEPVPTPLPPIQPLPSAGASSPPRPPPPPQPGYPSEPTYPVDPRPLPPTQPGAPRHPPTAPPPATQPLDPAPAPPYDPSLIGPLTLRRGLPCERGRAGWHVRGLGGYGFSFGTDEADAGAFGGVDIGHTFGGCVGVDVFYRYTNPRFDRTTPAGLLRDGGDIHFVGAKVTYEATFQRGTDFFWWVGVGPGWFKTRRLEADDEGIGILAEAGLGVVLDSSARLRFGANAQMINTTAGRMSAALDGSARWLTTLAPVLQLEIDL
jgi:hypothetical protein